MSSFIKDPDRHTRGVNAIAAVDGVGNRLRRREAAKIQAMRRRDAALATVASRAFRASSLGAIPTTGFGKITGRVGSTLNTYLDAPTKGNVGTGPVSPPRPGPLPPTGTGPVVDYLPPKRPTLNAGVMTGLVAQPKSIVNLTGGGTSPPLVVGTPGGPLTGGVAVGPATGGGGGGGSGGGGGGGGGGEIDVDDGGSVITDDGNSLPSMDGPNKKYLLYAAVAIGAYWLWRRSKKGT